MKPLSDTMRVAIKLARDSGGRLRYIRGGFWCGAHVAVFTRNTPYASTQTVRALVDRSLMVYTRFNTYGRGWPAEVQLTQLADGL